MNAQLRQIANLIKTHQFDQAHQQLDDYLAQHPEDAWAWYLRSFVESGRNEMVAAAQQALTLDADNDQLQARFEKLKAMQPRKPAQRWRLLAVVGLAVMAIITVGVLAVRSGAQTPDAPLPTLAVLDTSVVAALPTETAVEISTLTDDQGAEATSVDLPASVEATSIETEDEVVEAAPTDAATSIEAIVIVQNDNPVSLPSPNLPQINVGGATATIASQDMETPVLVETLAPDLPTDASTLTVPSRPTRVGGTTPTLTVSPTAVPITPTPAFGIITDNGVPMNAGLSIGAGEMRIVSATRPAEARIAELGGSVPSAPNNQSWVLVEALLICNNDSNCMPSPAELWVVSASGDAYRQSAQLNLVPSFGSALSNRQVWGYLGFVVPKNESNLRLVLVQGGQTLVFALQ